MAFVGFFVLAGFGALVFAVVTGRFLWVNGQPYSAAIVASLSTALAACCFATAWVWSLGLF